MGLLNRPAYSVEADRLIYDSTHPIDAAAVQVAVTSDTGGEIKRGQILDFTDGTYSIHAKGGEPSVIAAENISYESDDTEITAAVYISGTFRKSEIAAVPELTASDIETLRSKGIYLK